MSCPWSAGHGARGWLHPYLALVLGGVLTLSSACRSGSTLEPPPPVRVAIGVTAAETGINSIINLLQQESLARVGPDGRPQAVLAENWVVSGDRLAWRFHLRPGLTFQNGRPLDAANGVAGLRKSLEGGGSVGALRDVTSVDAVGPLDLVIHTRRPSSILIDALCSNIS